MDEITWFCCMCDRNPVPERNEVCTDCREWAESTPTVPGAHDATPTAEQLALQHAYALAQTV